MTGSRKAASSPRQSRAVRPTTILDDGQTRDLAGLVRAFVGPAMAARMDEMGFDMEEHVQLGTLRARCEEARKRRGLTIKGIAAELKVAQHRLRAVEGGDGRSCLDPVVSRKYVAYLGLTRWARRWAKQSPKASARVFGEEWTS